MSELILLIKFYDINILANETREVLEANARNCRILKRKADNPHFVICQFIVEFIDN